MTSYIAADDNLIHGIGATAAEALADALNAARQAGLIDESAGADGEHVYPRVTLAEWHERVRAHACTDTLAQAVRDCGGAIGWRELADGTMCSCEEGS
jgi:hypothetical protein